MVGSKTKKSVEKKQEDGIDKKSKDIKKEEKPKTVSAKQTPLNFKQPKSQQEENKQDQVA